jgi:hypothetical protein
MPTSPMTAPPPGELSELEEEITRALAELRAARRASYPRPTLDTARAEEIAEWRLNRLLDRRYAVLRT